MSTAVAYRLTKVPELQPGSIATAAVITCMATGRMLSGMGGGGEFLSPEVVQALRSNGTARAVCDASLLDSLIAMTRRSSMGEDVSKDAASIIARWPEAFA